MKIAIPGGTGQVGTMLARAFHHDVTGSLSLADGHRKRHRGEASSGILPMSRAGRTSSTAPTS
jgi:hypothetical protein